MAIQVDHAPICRQLPLLPRSTDQISGVDGDEEHIVVSGD